MSSRIRTCPNNRKLCDSGTDLRRLISICKTCEHHVFLIQSTLIGRIAPHHSTMLQSGLSFLLLYPNNQARPFFLRSDFSIVASAKNLNPLTSQRTVLFSAGFTGLGPGILCDAHSEILTNLNASSPNLGTLTVHMSSVK